MVDALSVVLGSLRLDGAVYFNAEFAAPWCAEAGYGMPTQQLQAIGADHIIFFHCVTHGDCQARLTSDHAPVALRRGDLVLFPRDARHLLGSDVALPPLAAALVSPARAVAVGYHVDRPAAAVEQRGEQGLIAVQRALARRQRLRATVTGQVRGQRENAVEAARERVPEPVAGEAAMPRISRARDSPHRPRCRK